MRESGTSERGRVCLVTSAHLSYNPRIVKEADTLCEAGYDVRVVSVNEEPAKWVFDCSLMESRPWTLAPFHVDRASWLISAARQKMLVRTPRLWRGTMVDWAFSRYQDRLARLAAGRRADLFIAHNLQALPAAFRAARSQNAKVGFDAEDFHRGEFAATPATKRSRELVMRIEQKYLPRCDYLSAASSGIARSYAEVLDVASPQVILNCFPLSHRSGRTPATELARERQGDGISLYWYSQVIGPDRGLEDAVRALGLLPGRLRLHLRGDWVEGYERQLLGLAERLGVRDRVHILPPAPPEQLVERSAQHDIGLAAELGHTPNRKISVTNKILNYMLAGVAIAATDVPAQREILATCEDAGFLYTPGDAGQLAQGLTHWLDDAQSLRRARAAARRCGETRYCWEAEQEKLVAAIAAVFRS